MADKLVVVGLAAKAEVGFDEAPRLTNMTAELLEKAGLNILNTGIVMSDYETSVKAASMMGGDDVAAILVCVGTWSDVTYILQFLKNVKKPVILHAFPGMETGSLCGTMQMTSVFHDIGFDAYKTVYADAGSDESRDNTIKAFSELIENRTDLGKSEETFIIGSIGGRSVDMPEIAFDEFALFKKTGAIVTNIPETELIELASAVPAADVKAVEHLVLGRGFHIDSTNEEIAESLRYYLAMKQIIAKYGLSGLAIRCYMSLMGKICMGFSLLSDEGYACSCEGDVSSAVMMKLLKDFTGQCINNTDILNPVPEDNAIIFAHCGSSGFSIAPSADEVHLCPARIVDSGVCSKFRPKLGLVTAADLVGHGEQLRMSVMVGEAIDKEYMFPGNQACIKFERNVNDICSDVISKACGHHWMVGYGDVSKQLEEYCNAHDIVFQKLT